MSNKDRFGCCNQSHSNNPLWGGPGFSRRRFFTIAGTGLSGYFFSKIARPLDVLAATSVTTLNTAKSCIFVFLAGAPSHVDTFDLKEGSWTPADFDPTGYDSIRFPRGLMPNLAEKLDRIAIVRSVQPWAAVHGLAQTWTQIARNPTAALGKIAPNIGAVVAMEKEQAGAKLPGFMALNAQGIAGSGYLDSRFSPFGLTPNMNGLTNSTHPDGESRFDTRFDLLEKVDGALRVDSPLGEDADAMGSFYEQAHGLMYDPQVDACFKFTPEERSRYGASTFGDACVTARNIVQADLGARYLQIQHGGWDHHQNIYDRTTGIYPRARDFDAGLAALIGDLSAAAGTVEGKSLLDETLIVVMGEFGRTVGNLNNQQGRDHYLQQFVAFAGGGAKGGRVVGATNETGAYTIDAGWSRNRTVRPEDIAATIYSAMGIDWTTVRYDDPFGRGFEYVPFAAEYDAYGPVHEAF